MRHLILTLLLAMAATASLADNRAVSGTHAIGNGRVCVYAKDADLTGIFGPTYSSPTLLTATLETPLLALEAATVRQSDVWAISLRGEGGEGRICDFVSPKGNLFVRQFDTGTPLRFRVELLPETRTYRESHLWAEAVPMRRASSAWRISVAEGVPFYSAYASPSSYHALLYTTGGARLEATQENGFLVLTVSGKGTFAVVFADSPEALDGQRTPRSAWSLNLLRRRSIRAWERTQRVLPEVDDPELDSTVRMISNYVLAQQDEGGGILAGKNYHMAYVRDQYGNSRGLLAMGHVDRARNLLDFYYRIWQKYGLIHNAQPMGNDGAFHCHEDDNTEITGYLVVQAMDYFRRSGDARFVERIMPMLRWAVQAQQADLIDGMLPFNGDETYIAGGIIPRSVMYHGSAEATLLFIEGSRHLLDFLAEHPSPVWKDGELAKVRADADACAAAYRDNFFEDGRLFLNNPAREEKVVYPPTRPGVCLYPGAPTAHYPETFHFKGNLYFCADCMQKDTTGIRPEAPRRFSIPSAFLFPIYIDAQLFSDQEKRALLDEVVQLYKRIGRIDERNIVLGYDYGLFLYALAEYGHPLAAEIYRKMMDLRDSSLSWVEYYVDGYPYNTPCRPWESSINIAAALKYKHAR
ncbi:MAG: hypothetical protein IJM60_02075 [Bacteroidales bacterium]|nr:hypothetical protein [Bacteroidales bacterium]